ncbi:MAG: polysaccharide lyase family 1 protein [Planctomycetaceae bacterium]
MRPFPPMPRPRCLSAAARILAAIACVVAYAAAGDAASPPMAQPLPAFLGAEGYGRWATGGRGGDVYHVTTLSDGGPGSLRDAIGSKQAEVPRTVVFDVAGTIRLKKPLRIEGVRGLTIAGQTAPGAGVAVRDHGVLFLRCTDIIVRYLRFRLGDETRTSEDVLHVGPEQGTCRDVIFDHVTATWGIDGIMDVYAADRFTMQWCLFGEALNDSTHHKREPHAMLMSFRKIKGNVTIHHNLLFSSRDRHPTLGGYPPPESNPEAIFDFRNNVIYNWEGACNLATGRFNIVGNYWRPGPDTRPYDKAKPLAPKAEAQGVTTGFLAGNVFESQGPWTAENDAAFEWGTRGGKYIGDVKPEAFLQPAEIVPVADRPTTQTAEEAYELVLTRAGASRVRDAADERVIGGVRDRTNRRIDSQRQVGGWPDLESSPCPTDTDADGMPDAWERSEGLDPHDAADRNRVLDGGYTALEHYLQDRADDPPA